LLRPEKAVLIATYRANRRPLAGDSYSAPPSKSLNREGLCNDAKLRSPAAKVKVKFEKEPVTTTLQTAQRR